MQTSSENYTTSHNMSYLFFQEFRKMYFAPNGDIWNRCNICVAGRVITRTQKRENNILFVALEKIK